MYVFFFGNVFMKLLSLCRFIGADLFVKNVYLHLTHFDNCCLVQYTQSVSMALLDAVEARVIYCQEGSMIFLSTFL